MEERWPWLEYVWLRLGDAAHYEFTATIEDAALRVASRMLRWEETLRWQAAGVQLPPTFVGYNYVSIYIGDKEGEWLRDLSDREKAQFAGALSRYWREMAGRGVV